MNRTEKTDYITEIKQVLSSQAGAIVLMDYTGMKVEHAVAVRRAFRKAECTYRVVKNTLLKQAVMNTPMEVIAPLLKGATGIAYSQTDPIAPAKVALKCAREYQKFVVKGGFFEGLLSAVQVEDLSKLASKDEVRSQLLATMLAAPQSFLRLLQAAPQNLVLVLAARERQQEGQ
jgi:large subunit ribosomal protein L10